MAPVPKGFAEKLVQSIPSWAWGCLGVFFGVVMTLQISGYNGSLNRVIEAHVKRIERSVDAIEGSASRMEAIIKDNQRQDQILADHEGRLNKIEKWHADRGLK